MKIYPTTLIVEEIHTIWYGLVKWYTQFDLSRGAKIWAYEVCTYSLAFYLQINTILRKIGWKVWSQYLAYHFIKPYQIVQISYMELLL